jgi:hypothetical protein
VIAVADTQVQSRAAFVGRWIWATAVGWVLAILSVVPAIGIWEIAITITQYVGGIDSYLLLDGWPGRVLGLSLLLGTLILMGLSMGYAQWSIAVKDKVDRRTWITSSVFTFVAGIIGLITIGRAASSLFDVQPGNLSGLDTTFTVNNTWPITVIFLGVALGLPMGIAQWLVLRKHFYRAGYWLLAITAASVAMFTSLVVAVSLVKNATLSSGLGCCVSPIVFGAVTGIALYSLLKRRKPNTTIV